MTILLIDNYDSFTYNLYHLIARVYDEEILVYRNDSITLDEIHEINPAFIVLSPGPGHPEVPRDFGICTQIISNFGQFIPILGVCLGHQGIGTVFGSTIKKAEMIYHGKTSQIHHNNSVLFEGIETPFVAMRYHSLVIDSENYSDTIEITASTDTGEIMAIQHKKYPVHGIQFHPESFFTPNGEKLMSNFLKIRPVNSKKI